MRNASKETKYLNKQMNDSQDKQASNTEESSFEQPEKQGKLQFTQLLANAPQQSLRQLDIVLKIMSSTTSSDKFIRLSSSIIKFMKTCQIVEAVKVDKLAGQIGNLRRLLRLNRIGIILKDWIKFATKKNHLPREIFDCCFKVIMFLCDTSDTLLYLMQHKVIAERNTQELRKIVIDLYFYECFVWLGVHIYQLYFHREKFKNEEDLRNKQLTILKYIVDTITSHNDWSRRCSTLDAKVISALGLFSSILGLYMIWK